MTVFQRTPHWILPRGDHEISNFTKTLYRWLPLWQRYRRRQCVDLNETEYISNNFADHDENIKLKHMALDMMHQQLPNQPNLWQKLTPNYPLGCKRVVISDYFFPALNRPNVELEARHIHSVDESTVRLVGNSNQEVAVDSHYDLIVLATGFRATEFLHPLKVVGRNGLALHELWKHGAQAFQGVCADDMPNFGMVMGPNTGLLHNSFILMIEAQSRYINGLIKPVLEARKQGGVLSLTPRPEKTREYNLRLQHRLKNFAVSKAECKNWYKTETGLITNLWPGTVLEFQKVMEQVDYKDYEAEGSSKCIVSSRHLYRVGRVIEEGGFLEKLSLAHFVLICISLIVGGFFIHKLIMSADPFDI